MGKVAAALIVSTTALIVVVAALFLGGRWVLEYSMTHRGSTDIDEDAVENAEAYRGAPVLWVGPEFDVDGDGEPEPLSRFEELPGPDRELYIAYGQCDFPDYEGGCALPLSITIEFGCNQPEDAPDDTIRGAPTSHLSHLRIHADDATITIFTAEHRERDVAYALYGANARASHISPRSDLAHLESGGCGAPLTDTTR